MHDYEIKILEQIKGKKESSLEELEESTGVPRDGILWAIENLAEKNAVDVKRKPSVEIALTEEGKADTKAFPEERLVKSLASGPKRMNEIKDQVGLSWAKRNGWIIIDKGSAALTEEGKKVASGKIEYEAKAVLNGLASGKSDVADKLAREKKGIVEALAKRGVITLRERSAVSSITITKSGEKLLETASKETGVGALSKEAIVGQAWKKQGFKPYNINAPSETIYPARLHPIREFMNFIRQKWLEMGFIEVSGPIIDSAFWNFDALFSPQDHPTREMQDTFFLSNPKQLNVEDIEALENVKKMHTTGWGDIWREELAKSAVLRTHTTSVSAHYMRKLASAVNANFPLKLFSIGSVFRNESVDYKHLAELHQVDGIIVGDNLTLANLIASLKEFYGKLGMENVKFRPSYFPFTEPSLEAYYYDEEHGDSIELLGGGIIRKEITKAMGIDKTVLAWGGGIERPMLNSRIFGLDSILTPYKNNIGWLRTRGNLKV